MRSSILFALTFASFLFAACDGPTDPPPGETPWLTRRDDEPVGDKCPHAGILRRSGYDTNGNGQLEDSEVVITEFECFPAPPPPPPTLVRSDVEPPGEHCPEGGTAVSAGGDSDGDGILDPEEIDQTSYVCSASELWNGDFTADDWADPAAVARLAGARVVTGSVTARREGPVALPVLELIGGDLVVSGPVTGLELPALRSIGGSLEIDSPALDSLTLPVLEHVGGALAATGNATNGQSLVLPQLRDVRGHVSFNWSTPGRVAMPRLTHVASLTLAGSSTELVLDALDTIDGDLSFADTTLPTLTLPVLRTMGGTLSAYFHAQLTTISLPELQTIGSIDLFALGGLTSVSMPSLAHCLGRVNIFQSAALASVDLGALTEVKGKLIIGNTPALHTLVLSQLVSVETVQDGSADGAIQLLGLGIAELSLPALQRSGGDVIIQRCLHLQRIAFDHLTIVPRLNLNDNAALTELRAPILMRLGLLSVADSPQLATIDLHALTSVRDIFLLHNLAMTDLSSFPALARVGSASFFAMPRLRDLRGTSLVELASLLIQDSGALTSLRGLEHVTQLSGRLDLGNDQALVSLDGLRQLVHVGGNLSLASDPALVDLGGLDSLLSVGGQLSLQLTGVPAAEIQAFVERLAH